MSKLLIAHTTARKMLIDELPASVITAATGLSAETVQDIAAGIGRDALAGNGRGTRVQTRAGTAAVHAIREQAVTQARAASAHIQRMRAAPPATQAELDALVAQHIARKGVTRCETRWADGADPTRGPVDA